MKTEYTMVELFFRAIILPILLMFSSGRPADDLSFEPIFASVQVHIILRRGRRLGQFAL